MCVSRSFTVLLPAHPQNRCPEYSLRSLDRSEYIHVFSLILSDLASASRQISVRTASPASTTIAGHNLARYPGMSHFCLGNQPLRVHLMTRILIPSCGSCTVLDVRSCAAHTITNLLRSPGMLRAVLSFRNHAITHVLAAFQQDSNDFPIARALNASPANNAPSA